MFQFSSYMYHLFFISKYTNVSRFNFFVEHYILIPVIQANYLRADINI